MTAPPEEEDAVDTTDLYIRSVTSLLHLLSSKVDEDTAPETDTPKTPRARLKQALDLIAILFVTKATSYTAAVSVRVAPEGIELWVAGDDEELEVTSDEASPVRELLVEAADIHLSEDSSGDEAGVRYVMSIM